MFDIKGLFTKDAIVRYLTQLPVLQTPVMDTIFTYRPQQAGPLIGADLIKQTIQAMPVVRRGAPSIPAGKEEGSVGFYEPLPIKPSKFISAADLNNLSILGLGNQQIWAQGQTDMLRRVCRATTEAICARSLTGTLQWPVALENGGFETWEIVYGTPLSYSPAALWSATGQKIKDAVKTLRAMKQLIQAKGYGGAVEIWAGENAYDALFALAENMTSTASLRIEITAEGINVGGYVVKLRNETSRNPQTGAAVPVVATTDVVMIALDAGHCLPYAAVDDLDANLEAMPFFVKPIKQDDPSGYKLVAQSKPFPVVNTDGICKATVAAA